MSWAPENEPVDRSTQAQQPETALPGLIVLYYEGVVHKTGIVSHLVRLCDKRSLRWSGMTSLEL